MPKVLAFLLSVALLQLSSTLSFGAEENPGAEAQLKHVQSLLEKGRLDEAEALLQQITEAYPTYAPAWLNLGVARYEKNRFDEAIAALQKAIALDPSSTNAHRNLGNTYMDAGRFDEAIAEHKKALDLDPDNAGILTDIGVALGAKGDLEGAVQHLTMAISKDPSFLLARKNLALAYYQKKNWTAAVDELLLVRDIDPLFPGVEDALRATLGSAFSDLKKWAKEKPSEPRAHYYYAYALAYRMKFRDAINELAKGAKYAASKAEFSKARGLFYQSWGKPAEAARAYEECIAQDGSCWACYAELMVVYTMIGKLKEAIETGSKAIEKNPSSASIHERLGTAYALDMQTERALDAFLKAESLGADNPVLYFNLAATSYNLKKYELSWKYARKASAMGAPNAKNLLNLLSKASQEPE